MLLSPFLVSVTIKFIITACTHVLCLVNDVPGASHLISPPKDLLPHMFEQSPEHRFQLVRPWAKMLLDSFDVAIVLECFQLECRPTFHDPPAPDYVPGPEEPEQAPPSPIYVPFVPEPVYPEFLPEDDVLPAEEQPLPVAASPTTESPGYIPESDPEEDPEEDDEEDPEEDPADYPADRGDDRDDEEPSDDDDDDDDDAEEEEHLAPADPAAVAYSADQDPYLAYRVTARMSIRPQAPAPFLSEEVAERLLALPTPPPSPLSPYSSPLPQIPSPPLPIPSPPPNSPTMADLYGFADMLDAAPGRQTSRELGYGIIDTWDDLVGAIQKIAPTTLEGVNQDFTQLATTLTKRMISNILS
ncbi:hypothetical protein Tco_1503604 [Tanacetum coccineum]